MFKKAVASLASRVGSATVNSTASFSLENGIFPAATYVAQAALKQDAGSTMQDISIARVMREKEESGAVTAKLHTVKSHDLVFEAVQKMAKQNVGAVIVTKGETTSPPSKDDIMGIITERDYVRKVAVDGKSSKEMKCSALMTGKRELVSLEPTDNVLKAFQLMEEKNIRHLPVFQDGNMLGMLSVKDIVSCLMNHQNIEISSMNEYINVSY